MPKCPNCPQFTSKDTDTEPEVDISVDDEGIVTGTVRVTNNCGDCSEELEEYTFDVEADLQDEVAEHRRHHAIRAKKAKKRRTHDLEVDADAHRTDETERTDRKGRVIKNPRYMKRFYGVNLDITVTCSCGETFTTTWTDRTPASCFDSLV